MERVHALHIASKDSQPGDNAMYFPQLLVGGSEVPSEGTLLFQMEDSDECAYATEKVILAPTAKRELVVIARNLEVVRHVLTGMEIIAEDKEVHRDFCRRLDGEAQYFLVEQAVIRQIEFQRKSLEGLFSVFQELAGLCDRLNVIQMSSGGDTVHLIPDHRSPEALNASLVPRNGKYYAPAPQKVRYLQVTEEVNDAEEAVVAAYHPDELRNLLPDSEIIELSDEYKEATDIHFPEQVHLFMIQKIRIKTGYIVRNYFHDVIKNETTRALDDFMKELG